MQLIGETRTGYEWLIDAIAAGIGALFASEFIVAFQATGPVFDGLALVPALVGGLVVGLIVEIATRYLTGGRYTHGAIRLSRPQWAVRRNPGPSIGQSTGPVR